MPGKIYQIQKIGDKTYYRYDGNTYLVPPPSDYILKDSANSFNIYQGSQIRDRESKLKDKGYTSDKPSYSKQYEGKTFGKQSRDPITGIYIAPGQIFDWKEFERLHGDLLEGKISGISKYEGGIEGFENDIKGDIDSHKKATRWFHNNINTLSENILGEPYFAKTPSDKDPYSSDDYFGSVTQNVDNFYKKESQVGPPVTEEERKKVYGVGKYNGDIAVDPLPKPKKNWWFQDINNLALAASAPNNRYDPALFQVPLVQTPATYLDPSRQIAARQELYNKQQDLLNSTAPGSIARSNALAMAGASAEDISNVLSNYEQQNVGIANRNAEVNANALTQNLSTNTAARKQYLQENAILNQQFDNSKFDKRSRVVNAFNQGYGNSMVTNEWLPELYPNVGVDAATGKINIDRGTDLTGIKQQNATESYKTHFKEYIDNYGSRFTDQDKLAVEASKYATNISKIGGDDGNSDTLTKMMESLQLLNGNHSLTD